MRGGIYARYSTELQSEASIEDQVRVCKRLAEQNAVSVDRVFTDAAISGGTSQRPEYQAMLAAARAGEIDIIIAEDCSRLWRNLAEQAPRLAELADLGVHVITQDLDTRHDSAEWMGPILGAGAQHYRKEIARRTRRGLEGRARAGRSAGGRAYGYLSQAEAGERQVDPERAPIVRELFERFARGESLRALANDLNARGVPSPGAAWRRTQRAGDGLWRISALHALLQNEIYTGRVVWNKSRWVRAASDSKRRRRIENPPDQWIVHERPDLALVDEVTWRRVQERFRERGEVFAPGRGATCPTTCARGCRTSRSTRVGWRPERRRVSVIPHDGPGYAAQPGTGPAGRTCGHCAYLGGFRRYRKCHLVPITLSPATDISIHAPACRLFTPIGARLCQRCEHQTPWVPDGVGCSQPAINRRLGAELPPCRGQHFLPLPPT